MIAIVDYGCGNVKAFANIYHRLRVPFRLAGTASDLRDATKAILPGVGAFDQAAERLETSDMRAALEDFALRQRRPVLGVCVGMQLLGRSSEEGKRAGLGWIDGTVKEFSPATSGSILPVPHMGWNDVRPTSPNALFPKMDADYRYYFLHSYYFSCADQSVVAAVTEYGRPFCSGLMQDNIYGVQFHPEKSHEWGTRLLENFARL